MDCLECGYSVCATCRRQPCGGPLHWVARGTWVAMPSPYGFAEVLKWKKGRFRVRFPPGPDGARAERSVPQHEVEQLQKEQLQKARVARQQAYCGPLRWATAGGWVGMRGFGVAQIVKWKNGRYRVRWPAANGSTGGGSTEYSERSVSQHELEPAVPPSVLEQCPEGAGALIISGAPQRISSADCIRRHGAFCVDINGEIKNEAARKVVETTTGE